MPGIYVCSTCNRLDGCVCAIQKAHAENCPFRRSVCCPVGIECEHGYDLCPICDPCTCGVGFTLPPANKTAP